MLQFILANILMNNEDPNIENLLTASAKEELEKILSLEKSKLLIKAKSIAQTQIREKLEISLKDIIEARSGNLLDAERKIKNAKKGNFYRKIFIYSGLIYALLGFVIYLVQNKELYIEREFYVESNLGLLIAMLGLVISFATFLATEGIPKKTKIFTTVSTSRVLEYEDKAASIIEMWMKIEDALSKIIELQTGIKVTSFNQIINYLNSDNLNLETRTTIKNLLKTRNAVVHNKMHVSDNLVRGYIHLSSSIIDNLEKVA